MENSFKTSIKTADLDQIASYLKYLYNTAISISEGRIHHPVWSPLYDMIFSPKISEEIFHRFHDFHFIDPDGDYYDDVKEFVSQFDDYASSKLYDKNKAVFLSFDEWKKEDDMTSERIHANFLKAEKELRTTIENLENS